MIWSELSNSTSQIGPLCYIAGGSVGMRQTQQISSRTQQINDLLQFADLRGLDV
jgi:hypothetical protein